MNRFYEHEAEKLAFRVLGIEQDDKLDVNELLVEKFGCDLEQFNEIASRLVKFTTPFERGDGEHYCFVEPFGNGVWSSIARLRPSVESA